MPDTFIKLKKIKEIKNMIAKQAFEKKVEPNESESVHFDNGLLIVSQFFGYDLCRKQHWSVCGKVAGYILIAFALFLTHLQSIDFIVAIAFTKYDDYCRQLDDVKFLIVKGIMTVSVDIWLIRRKALMKCFDTVLDAYRSIVNTQAETTVKKATRNAIIITLAVPIGHTLIASAQVATVGARHRRDWIRKLSWGYLSNSTDGLDDGIFTLHLFESFVYTMMVEGARLAGAAFMAFNFYILEKSLYAISKKIDNHEVGVDVVGDFRTVRKAYETIENTFGITLLYWFAILFGVTNCDIFLAAQNMHDAKHSWLHLLRIGLFWVPYLGIYWFAAEVSTASRKLQLSVRNAIIANKHGEKLAVLANEDFVISMSGFGHFDRKFILGLWASVATFSVMLIQMTPDNQNTNSVKTIE